MKKKIVSVKLFRVISVLPLVLMFAALGFAYLSNKQLDKPDHLGTLNTDISWKAKLLKNQYFETEELGSEYLFIRELIDKIQFDLKFSLSGAPEDATLKINYRVDGVLIANNDGNGNGLLLMQDFSNLGSGSTELSGQMTDDNLQFDLILTEYPKVIEGFQSKYRVGVKTRLDLKIKVDTILEAGIKSIAKSTVLDLTIPLDGNVFQITGSPSKEMEFTASMVGAAPSGWTYGTTLYYLGAAVLMLLITIAVFLFFSPPRQAQDMAMLKQALQKCKSSMVAIKEYPKDTGLIMLQVMDIDGLVSLAENTGQPILYYNAKDDHLFLVSSDQIMYYLELRVNQAKTKRGLAQGKAAL